MWRCLIWLPRHCSIHSQQHLSNETLSVAIIGGGISGLHTAYRLAMEGVSFVLIEAKPQLGGRIAVEQVGGDGFDLGPAWFWPGQSRILSLLRELDLDRYIFQQYAEGAGLYEPISGTIQRGVSGISMQGSYRLDGGLIRLIRHLHAAVTERAGAESVKVGSAASTLRNHNSSTGEAHIEIGLLQQESITADKVVLALPPRVVINSLRFSPEVGRQRMAELNAVNTWMAGHAKAVLIYPTAFWRNAGLSGDVISQVGPLAEIHDASPRGENNLPCSVSSILQPICGEAV